MRITEETIYHEKEGKYLFVQVQFGSLNEVKYFQDALGDKLKYLTKPPHDLFSEQVGDSEVIPTS